MHVYIIRHKFVNNPGMAAGASCRCSFVLSNAQFPRWFRWTHSTIWECSNDSQMERILASFIDLFHPHRIPFMSGRAAMWCINQQTLSSPRDRLSPLINGENYFRMSVHFASMCPLYRSICRWLIGKSNEKFKSAWLIRCQTQGWRGTYKRS